ncbi:MAG: hypothetical protein KGL69_11195 [Alphaproteobacteria bacterium]|jgi:CYTH domain-containing protein|nr:hypothetical protein [Alphaproteobacteria bacterium]
MDVDADIAAALGWPKLKYAVIERERRWLCDAVPYARVVSAEVLTDFYVAGTRLRLRSAVPVGGGEAKRRLARKADVGPATRLITSIYLSEHEFALLSGLPGKTLVKVRHHLAAIDGVAVSVDRFEGDLAGLVLAEAEFESDAQMAAFPAPDFALGEVTNDPRYSGGCLVEHGVPV